MVESNLKIIMYKFFVILLLLFLDIPMYSQVQREKYSFNHGPYLQEITSNSVIVKFSTNYQGLSWVDVRKKGEDSIKSYYEVSEGLRNLGTLNSININGLIENEAYEYRLCSKKLDKYISCRATLGDTIVSPWYSFRTMEVAKKNISFVALSDMHEQPIKMQKLLNIVDYKSADAVFLIGDMIGEYPGREYAFANFIDSCVNMFAKEKSLLIIRGNHETRNLEAPDYRNLIKLSNGKLYGTYKIGETMFIILDTGEDKPDNHMYYDGLVDFESYRKEQAEWFKNLIETDEYKTSKWHIVLSHFPVVTPKGYYSEYGMDDYSEKFLSLFNLSDIDLIVSGHTHEYYYVPKSKDNNFQSIINSTETVVRVDISNHSLNLKVYDLNGRLILDKIFK